MRNSITSVSFDEALTQIGKAGKYQKILFFTTLITLTGLSCLFATLQISLFPVKFHRLTLINDQTADLDSQNKEQNENLNLEQNIGNDDILKSIECNNFEMCQQSSLNCYAQSEFEGIIFQWSLFCKSQKYVELIVQLMLTITSVSFLVSSHFSHRFAYLKILRISMIWTISWNIIIAFSPFVQIYLIALCALCFGIPSVFLNQLLLMYETISANCRINYLIYSFLSFSLGYAIIGGLSYWITSWRILHIFSIFLLTIGCILNFARTTDSPRFLASARGKFFIARKILEWIARFNKRQVFCETLEGEKVIGYTENTEMYSVHDFQESSTNDSAEKSKIRLQNFQKGPRQFATVLTPTGSIAVTEIESKDLQKTRTLLDLCFYKSIKKQSILFSLLFIFLFFVIEGMQLRNNSFIKNYRVLNICYSINYFLAILILKIIIQKLNKQAALAFGQGLACLCIIAYIAINEPANCQDCCIEHYVKIVLINISICGITSTTFCLFIQSCENICTVLRIILLGQIFFLGHASCIGSYWFFQIIVDHQQDPVVYYTAAMGLCGILSCAIPDLQEEILKDFLDEQKSDLQRAQELSIIVQEQNQQVQSQIQNKSKVQQASNRTLMQHLSQISQIEQVGHAEDEPSAIGFIQNINFSINLNASAQNDVEEIRFDLSSDRPLKMQDNEDPGERVNTLEQESTKNERKVQRSFKHLVEEISSS